jgi:SpoVK/Ycf46/Vps4 family AAA+-type ATPase
VAWIDEIDKAGIDPRQGGGDGGTSKRVIGQILTFMAESDAPVFWVFTANRVDGLPPELLRKGRLDELFNVAPPNAIERREILEIHLRKRKQDPALVENLDLVVEESLGYVGAELEAAVNEAVIEAFSGAELDGELILAQLKSSVPIKEAFKEDFERMKVWAHNNARPASTPMEGEDTGGREDVAPARGRRVRQRRIQKGSAVE